jgi:hypothetical protein
VRLYEIAQEVREVVAFIEDAHTPKESAEAPDPEELFRQAWEHWDQMDQAFDIKVENAALARQEHTRYIETLDKEIKRLQSLKATMGRTVDSIDRLLVEGFVLAKKKRVDGDRIRVRIQRGPVSVDVTDINLVPKEFIRRVDVEVPGVFQEELVAFIRGLPVKEPFPYAPQVDKDAVKKNLKAERPVPGCELTDGKMGVRVW